MKDAYLFGGEPLISFKEMITLRIPTDLDAAWYAQTVDEWEAVQNRVSEGEAAPSFSSLLKSLWRPSQSLLSHDVFLTGSISVMYGVLSVAREVTRREEGLATSRPAHNSTALYATVEQALAHWESAWQRTCANDDLPWMIPTCTCLLQLARSTLYDISPVDLQIVAGKNFIEGKRKGPADYAKALRRIRSWAREERGRLGVASE